MSLPNVSTGDPHVAAHNAERAAVNSLETSIATKIPIPGGPSVGSLLRYNGAAWVPAVTRLFEGTGHPEGVVAAPIGSRYVDTAGTNGAVEWLKARGVDANDNTGWEILGAPDTGVRNVIAAMAFSSRGTGLLSIANIRRVGNLVDAFFQFKMPTNTASPWAAATMPLGFRPSFNRYGALQDNNELASTQTLVGSDGVINFYTPVSAKTDSYNGCWMTADAWPSSLPGQPL